MKCELPLFDVNTAANIAMLRLIPENSNDQDLLKKLYKAELLVGSCWGSGEVELMVCADIQLIHKFN